MVYSIREQPQRLSGLAAFVISGRVGLPERSDSLSSSLCQVCKRSDEMGLIIDTSKSNSAWGRELGVDEASVRRHLKHAPLVVTADTTVPAGESETHAPEGSSYVRFSAKAWGFEDYRDFIRQQGQDPDEVTFTWGWTSNPAGGFWNKLNNVRPLTATTGAGPAWPVVQQAAAVVVAAIKPTPRPASRWNTAVLMSDPQTGFRLLSDGTLDPFHDDDAMDVALQIVAIENPDRTVLMGDIVDMAEQGKFAQEAAFANTTQAALDRTHLFAAQMRAATTGLIDWIEGNHDRRLQNFIETNAKAAFGLRQANMPEAWPVMSLPYLLRLNEHNITYHDAYPTSHVWINNSLRAEHGAKVNSNGSTAQKYMNETSHISRAFGHTHRLEMLSRTTYDRAGKIRSMAINPGCLCRVDGAVPSVHGAIGGDGRPAQVFEDWQQGVAVIRYTDDQFYVDLVQIDDGMTVYQGQEIRATET